MTKQKIGILGSGDVGQALGSGFATLGHDVMLGAREKANEKTTAWASKTGARAWVFDVAEDQDGRPVIAYTRLPQETDHRYHYARWDGAEWSDTELCAGGKWFPQTPAGKVETEPHYSGGLTLDHTDPSVVYLSRPVNGVREIERWTTADSGKTWKSKAITSGSAHDNIRPFVVRHHTPDGPTVLWLNLSGHYTHYTNYLASVKMDRP